jgi:uncharacterized protein YndB with AHSA1/START domain
MPTACRSRTIAASAQELWDVVSDPHHLPRWWPRVERVEDVDERAFTEVMRTRKGKLVRADFDVIHADGDGPQRSLRWGQRIEGTPFAAVLTACEIELRLEPADAPEAATEVTIEMHQELRGGPRETLRTFRTWSVPRAGSFLVRRAAVATVREALDGLERISG